MKTIDSAPRTIKGILPSFDCDHYSKDFDYLLKLGLGIEPGYIGQISFIGVVEPSLNSINS